MWALEDLSDAPSMVRLKGPCTWPRLEVTLTELSGFRDGFDRGISGTPSGYGTTQSAAQLSGRIEEHRRVLAQNIADGLGADLRQFGGPRRTA